MPRASHSYVSLLESPLDRMRVGLSEEMSPQDAVSDESTDAVPAFELISPGAVSARDDGI